MNYPRVKSDISEVINERRSVRRFLDRPVTDEVLKGLFQAGSRAAFAAQLCSVVYTRDRGKMAKLGIGAYSSAPVLLIFLVDLCRMEKIIEARGHRYDYDDMMTLWLGIQDVSLFVQNMTLAAEALGLGSVLLGMAPSRANRITEAFKVPKRVFPVVGMSLGYPDPSEETEVRPRFPIEMTASEDQYRDHTKEDIEACMKQMDEGYLAQGYYIRKNAKIPLTTEEDTIGYDHYSWSEHISRKMCQGRWTDHPLSRILEDRGFYISPQE
jgi:nitroreductase